MRKSRSSTLYLIGLLLAIVGNFMRLVDLSNHTNPATGVAVGSTPAVFLISGIFISIGFLLGVVAWIGALVRTARLQYWGWFIFLLLLSGLAMLVYIFAGSETQTVPESWAEK
jgi:hypothetical protein